MQTEIIKYHNGRKFKITMTPIKQTQREYKDVWFLDEIEGNCLNNICNGSKEYCLRTFKDIVKTNGTGVLKHKWNKDGERCLYCGSKDWMQGNCK